MKPLKLLLTPLRWLVRFVLALVIVFEEWGYVPLRKAMALLARLPVLRQLERLLGRLPPYGALCALALPSLLILPLKILALWLIAEGHALTGVAVVIGAKVAGTAVLAWVFQLIQPSLMKLAWFVVLYGRWSGWKADLLAWIRQSAAWRSARAMKSAARKATRSVKRLIGVRTK